MLESGKARQGAPCLVRRGTTGSGLVTESPRPRAAASAQSVAANAALDCATAVAAWAAADDIGQTLDECADSFRRHHVFDVMDPVLEEKLALLFLGQNFIRNRQLALQPVDFGMDLLMLTTQRFQIALGHTPLRFCYTTLAQLQRKRLSNN